jgi:DNA polymerase-3 subunit alpha
MAVFVLEGLDGTVETLIMPARYPAVSEWLADDLPVMVRGKAEVGEDRPRLIADEVNPMEQAAERVTEAVTLKLPPGLDQDAVDRLADLVQAHRGSTPLFLELSQGDALQVRLRVDEDLSVRPDGRFTAAVENLLGPGSLVWRLGNGAHNGPH